MGGAEGGAYMLLSLVSAVSTGGVGNFCAVSAMLQGGREVFYDSLDTSCVSESVLGGRSIKVDLSQNGIFEKKWRRCERVLGRPVSVEGRSMI